jgi:hypothetical protein
MTLNSESFRTESFRQAAELEQQDEKEGRSRSFWERVNEVIHAEVPIELWQPRVYSETRPPRVINGRAERYYQVPLAPEPLPIVSDVLRADSEIGTDANGQTLYSERRAWCDEQRIEPNLRALYMRLLQVAAHEKAMQRAKDWEEREAERESRRRR